MKTKNLILTIMFLFSLAACEKEENTIPESLVYQDHIIEGSTNSEGKININTVFPEKEITYDIQVVDTEGNPVENMNVTYYQTADHSVIFVNDPQQRYNSAFLMGDPVDLDKIAGTRDPDAPGATYQSKSVLLTLGLLITVGAIVNAELKIIKNAWVIQQFYISDAVVADRDYILYCKTFEEIAELMKARTGIALNASSILISLVNSFGGSSAVEIASSILMESTQSIRDKLLYLAMDHYGMTMDQLINRRVAVKIYPFDQDENFSNVRNLFALYEIDLNNPICDNYVNDVPYQVNNIITQDIISEFEEQGLTIHKGFSPPDITGNYYLNSLTNMETGTTYKSYSYQFFNQKKDYTIELKIASNTSDAQGKGAFISGNETTFTVYCEIENNVNDGGTMVYIRSLDVYSGEITSDGIRNYQNGFIIVDKQNDVNRRFMNVGDSRVVYEADGLGQKVSSFPYVAKGGAEEACADRYLK